MWCCHFCWKKLITKEYAMKRMIKIATLAMTLTLAVSGIALATPSTQIWIPSTDIQPFAVGHLGIDNYFRSSGVAKPPPPLISPRDANIMDIGLTVGVLPFEKIQMEVGADFLTIANDPNDNHPFSGNFKIGTPEDSICKNSPAIAVGMYNIGVSQPAVNAPGVTSGQNIVYALVAKTLPAIRSVPSLGGLF